MYNNWFSKASVRYWNWKDWKCENILSLSFLSWGKMRRYAKKKFLTSNDSKQQDYDLYLMILHINKFYIAVVRPPCPLISCNHTNQTS